MQESKNVELIIIIVQVTTRKIAPFGGGVTKYKEVQKRPFHKSAPARRIDNKTDHFKRAKST